MSIVCYIPTLEGQADDMQRWLDAVRERYGVVPVLLPPVSWNDDLTPWPAAPIFKKGKPFGGQADAYLDRLEKEIIPGIEAERGLVPTQRWLIGISLAGLFAVWAAARTRLFTRVAAISGSFWYPGFADWLESRSVYIQSAYISLGDKEADTRNAHLRSIAEDTGSVVRILASKGVQTTFEWTEGTHFGPILPRLDKALVALMRLQRLTLDAGFTCPNRDGTLGVGGCTFCDNAAFHPGYTRGKSIPEQIEAGIRFHAARGRKADGYLAYFQAYSNTYAPLPVLRERFESALTHPLVKGLVIGTRPDCIDGEKLDYLASLRSGGAIVEVEYGIESVFDETLQRVHRGHDFACTARAIQETARRGIPVGGHVILGLPGETRDMLLKEADILSTLPLSSLKFHQLQIIRGTQMEKEFARRPEDFLRMGPDEYVELLVDILERLRPDIRIVRIASSVPPAFTDAPWGLLRPDALLKRLEARMKERNTWQGRLLNVSLT